MTNTNLLSPQQHDELLSILKTRFEKNTHRHKNIGWEDIQAKLEKNPDKLWSLNEMEKTGGEPDVIGFDAQSGQYIFCDCSPESPKGRRSVCYDREGLESRKEFKPENNAVDMAGEMGIELLTEEEYMQLQELGDFDLKSTSWVKTPDEIREKGDAYFCNKRHNRVFTYYNGAQSYYSSRGFRGLIRV